jgi:hypothetical protein
MGTFWTVKEGKRSWGVLNRGVTGTCWIPVFADMTLRRHDVSVYGVY